MDGKSVRIIAVFGLMAALAMTVMMAFSLNQLPDAQTPQIASDVAADFARALQPSPPANVKLTIERAGKGANAARVYCLTLRPADAIAADEKTLSRLMFKASERCAGEIGDVPCEVTIRCVAELPGGGERTAAFAKEKSTSASLALIRPLPAAPAPTPAASGTAKR